MTIVLRDGTLLKFYDVHELDQKNGETSLYNKDRNKVASFHDGAIAGWIWHDRIKFGRDGQNI